MLKKINHIGIAVSSLEQQLPFYRDILKLEFEGFEEVSYQKVKVAIFKIGEVRIELLQPISDDSPIAKFIEKKGEGMHHIAYQTDNIENQIHLFQQHDIQMIDEKPRDGAQQTRIAFVHPKSTGRVLTEICESKGDSDE